MKKPYSIDKSLFERFFDSSYTDEERLAYMYAYLLSDEEGHNDGCRSLSLLKHRRRRRDVLDACNNISTALEDLFNDDETGDFLFDQMVKIEAYVRAEEIPRQKNQS